MDAQAELERLEPAARRDFIKSKAPVWRAFGEYLAKMSYGKCWYSESPDPQSFFDVDHYRPKSEAKRSESDVDKPGYEWLAFSWENFRYAANCSNRVSTNDDTGCVDGKGSWFPLLDDSPKACWDSRCEETERPVLLDPVKQADVDLIDVQAEGRMGPSRLAVGSAIHRVTRSCELYGLNLPKIKEARQCVMREVTRIVDILNKDIDAANDPGMPANLADRLGIPQLSEVLREKTKASSPYSKAARAALIRAGYAELCAKPEERDGCAAA
jgi:hypothetical protein